MTVDDEDATVDLTPEQAADPAAAWHAAYRAYSALLGGPARCYDTPTPQRRAAIRGHAAVMTACEIALARQSKGAA
jgi:hypothetical protein